jgi:hypothetical protein
MKAHEVSSRKRTRMNKQSTSWFRGYEKLRLLITTTFWEGELITEVDTYKHGRHIASVGVESGKPLRHSFVTVYLHT